ncbi:MAG: hypothetical protein KC561_01615 [Myxococcales bacterium]|nr:hypothetical protein [Myxococcales bacterium]
MRRLREHAGRHRRHPTGSCVDPVSVLPLSRHIRLDGLQAATRRSASGLAQRGPMSGYGVILTEGRHATSLVDLRKSYFKPERPKAPWSRDCEPWP